MEGGCSFSSFSVPYLSKNKGLRNPKVISLALSGILLVFFAYVAFAFPAIIYVSPTLQENATSGLNWTHINLTSSEALNQSFLKWGNLSGFTNVTMANDSLTNWYVNMTDLVDGTYNYTIWAQNTTGGRELDVE